MSNKRALKLVADHISINPSGIKSLYLNAGQVEKLMKLLEGKAREKKEHPPRPRNLLFDALVQYGERLDPLKFPPGSGGRIARALAEIQKYTPIFFWPEIKRRADNYCAHFGETYLTATARASHWVKCDAPPQDEQAGVPMVN